MAWAIFGGGSADRMDVQPVFPPPFGVRMFPICVDDGHCVSVDGKSVRLDGDFGGSFLKLNRDRAKCWEIGVF